MLMLIQPFRDHPVVWPFLVLLISSILLGASFFALAKAMLNLDRLIAALQKPRLRKLRAKIHQFIKKCLNAVCEFIHWALTAFEEAIVSPVKRPKIAIFVGAMGVASCYVLSLAAVANFFVFADIGFIHPIADLTKQLYCFGLVIVMMFTAMYFYSQAERERIKLNEQWHNLMGSDWF